MPWARTLTFTQDSTHICISLLVQCVLAVCARDCTWVRAGRKVQQKSSWFKHNPGCVERYRWTACLRECARVLFSSLCYEWSYSCLLRLCGPSVSDYIHLYLHVLLSSFFFSVKCLEWNLMWMWCFSFSIQLLYILTCFLLSLFLTWL